MANRAELAVEVVKFALDLAGVVDPTGIADGASALISLGQGKWVDAAISGAGFLPYIGDAAKVIKVPRYAKAISEAIQLGAKEADFARQLQLALRKLKGALDKVPMNSLPVGAQAQLRKVKAEVEVFLQRRLYKPGRHEQVGQRGLRGSRMTLNENDAYQLLNSPTQCKAVSGGKQFVSVKDGKVYAFQPDNAGAYHGYEITGWEVHTKYPSVQNDIARLLGVTPTKLKDMKELP
jgi:hypothetical protein